MTIKRLSLNRNIDVVFTPVGATSIWESMLSDDSAYGKMEDINGTQAVGLEPFEEPAKSINSITIYNLSKNQLGTGNRTVNRWHAVDGTITTGSSNILSGSDMLYSDTYFQNPLTAIDFTVPEVKGQVPTGFSYISLRFGGLDPGEESQCNEMYIEIDYEEFTKIDVVKSVISKVVTPVISLAIITTAWILAGGIWDDGGTWQDDKLWID